MPDLSLINAVQKLAKPLYSIVKAVGPFVISQSGTAVENYSNFKLNKARLEALSILLAEEAKNISADRSKLRDKIINGTGLERVQAQNDYNLLTKELNKLSTIDKVKDFINDNDEIDGDAEISDSWIDKFNQLASSLNEDWRKKLLAKAFARELKKPGSINFVVLNCIASFDEMSFRKFGILVNSSIRLYEGNILPSANMNLKIKTNIGMTKYSNLVFEISHLNLINPHTNNYLDIADNHETFLRYGRKTLCFERQKSKAPERKPIFTVFFSHLGNSIAELYDRELTLEGDLNFVKFKEIAIGNHYVCSESQLSEVDYINLGN